MSARRRTAAWAGHAAVAFTAWLAFTQSLSATELAAGLAAAAVAGTASSVAWAHGVTTLAGAWRDLAQAWRLPWYALAGTGEILLVLGRQLLAGRPAPSLLRAVAYPLERGRRAGEARAALAVAYTTITPNFIVLGLDRDRGLLWYHQIRAGPVLPMTVRLGARP